MWYSPPCNGGNGGPCPSNLEATTTPSVAIENHLDHLKLQYRWVTAQANQHSLPTQGETLLAALQNPELLREELDLMGW